MDPLMAIGAAASLGSSIFGAISGIGQRRRARQLRESAVNPGYQMNTGVIDNARMLEDQYTNYQMPGYQQALANINQSASQAFNQGVQGASSSGDVMDLAARIAYGQGQNQNQLAVQNAQGKQQAFGQFINANAQAGQERVNRNAYDRQMYQQQLAEAAALYNAGSQNIGNAISDVGSVGSALAMNPSLVGQGTQVRRQVPVGLQARFVGVPTNNLPSSTLGY